MSRIRFVDVPPFQDASRIEARLTETLKRLRARNQPEKTAASENAEGRDEVAEWERLHYRKSLTFQEKDKIRRRAVKLAGRQALAAGVTHLKKEELARIESVFGGVELVEAKSEGWADEVAAALHAEMPWMAPATEYAWHALRRAARRAGASRCAGDPERAAGDREVGLGTQLAGQLALPTVDIDASKGGAGFAVAGVERGWGTALPGRPLDLILAKRIANPVVIVDEICKAKRATSNKDHAYSFADALLALIEPATAAAWECICFRLRFDMSTSSGS